MVNAQNQEVSETSSNVVPLRPVKKQTIMREKRTYPIIADFFALDNSIKPVWRNRGINPRSISKNAQDYLHENTHDKAWIAVVHNEETGRLICIWRRDVHGDVHSLYRDDPYDPKLLTTLPMEWFELAPKN